MPIQPIDVNINGPLNAFGEIAVAEYTPIVQIDAVYGIRTTDVDQLTRGTGAANSSSGKLFVCASGTDADGYASIRSARGFRYRPGQAGRAMFTALFGTPVADNVQRAGFLCHEGSLGFGYNGTAYGVYRQTDGKTTIQTLTVDTAATGGETAVVTLDGVAHNVSLTSGTKAHNAYEIAATSFPLWSAEQNGDTVVFLKPKTGLTAGAFSLVSGTAAASFVADQAGANDVYDWTAQADWNLDSMDGTGGKGNPSGMTIDPTMGNVYRVDFQYLGFGAICYSVEDDETGRWQAVHRINYTNKNTTPSIPNPTMRIGWMSENFGATTAVTIKGASAEASVGGKFITGRAPRGLGNSRTGVSTTFENLVSIRVRTTFNGQLHLGEVFPTAIHAAVDGTKPAELSLFFNPTFTGETNWSYVDEGASIVEQMTSDVTVSGGREIPIGSMSKVGSTDEHVGERDVRMEPGDVLCIALRTTSGSTDATASVRWFED